MEFDKVYENTKIIRLEDNYRSTQNILNVASHLISNNENRLGKKLNSNKTEGKKIRLNCFRNGKDEATGVSGIIENELKKLFIQ